MTKTDLDTRLETPWESLGNSKPSRTAPSLIHSSIQPTVILDVVSSNYSSRVDLLYILAPRCICKVLVVAKQMLFIIRILLHHPVVFNTLKHYLTETIILGNIRHLAIVNPVHHQTSLRGIVNLHGFSPDPKISPKEGLLLVTYHCPSFDTILNHKILRQGCRDLDHMPTICFFGHPGLSIAQDGQTKIPAGWKTGRFCPNCCSHISDRTILARSL
jgi:hypothetical protein